MTFIKKWQKTVAEKNTLLCVNIDPAEFGQRANLCLNETQSKLDWSRQIVDQVAPYAAAIKPNRQYYKDFSRSQMRTLNDHIHSLGLLSIDDSKIADIGDTNDAALYHAVQEGFDAVTYAPFPGNIAATCKMALQREIGLIPLALMSNPEYLAVKNLMIDSIPAYEYYARESAKHGAAGIVVGAPSEKNHITSDEITRIKGLIGEMTVLVPGIGAQGGDLGPIVETFGNQAIISVGRDIAYHTDPASRAAFYQDLINKYR